MALTKPAANAPAASFEPMEDDTGKVANAATTAANEAPKPAANAPTASAPAAAPTPAPAQTTAVAARPAGAVTTLNSLRTVLDDSQDQIGPEALEAMGFGALPRVTVSPGIFQIDKQPVGDKVEVELLSWNYMTLVTTGVKDKGNPEANKKIRTSYDGVNLIKGEGTVADYITALKAEGYKDAGSKKYVEVYANLRWTAKGGEVAVEDQKMVQLSLSPQSVARWQAYLLEKRLHSRRGIEASPILVIEAESKTIGSDSFGIMKFGAKR